MSPELPAEIWKDRVENEIKSLENLKVLEKDSILRHDNNVELIINIKALGFILGNSKKGIDLIPQKTHRIFLKINKSFPYPGGLDFSWYSNIFHPNIHPVELSNPKKPGTGYICLNVLKKWSRLSDLKTTTKALERLVENPNPDDPLNYDICLEAAEFFKQNSMEDLKKQYGVKEDEKEDKDDDIIIIED
ncbi:MAG: ubiquitin-conjugating enzyme E2 [Promethearchaeota archaeon]